MTSNDLPKAIEEIQSICLKDGNRSQCFDDGAQGFYDSNRHFLDSSAQFPAISVQPGSVDDLRDIMKVLAKYRVPFAIKSGGHAMNPGFSSTSGVQVYMCRFNQVKCDDQKETIDIGAGCIWDEVYGSLVKSRRNIVGGTSSSGVGVAGYLLGGGYSLKTNQHGLGIDNVVAIQVILPNGDVHVVDENNESDLFYALKGGGTNFGIVTRYTLRTHRQGDSWGGYFVFGSEFEKRAKSAIADFVAQEKRPEAAIDTAFRLTMKDSEPKFDIYVGCVFDGARPVNDPWQRFVDIDPSKQSGGVDVDFAAWRRRSKRGGDMSDKEGPGPMLTAGAHGRFGCIMVTHFTKKLINAIAEEVSFVAKDMVDHKGKLVLLDVRPFLPNIFDHGKASAWPHSRDTSYSPLLAYFL
ncbi:hypothetical protein FRB94_002600 [Tulasnella sp. JGI-2019a]|nr:hypothetical protein FRB93_008187 [Tulasnella sp. JGI-2019a]KAG8986695.1 hypothetical protein FRB94_002600 [Tulasnella sp. JGI-2019a]KAG9027098.1 hypothetical protein FRB95_008146 [Tulasnella sp. JGI-2019a]